MIIARKLKLAVTPEQHDLLVEIRNLYHKCYDQVLEYGFKNKVTNSNDLHDSTYYALRNSISPKPPATIVISSRVSASATLKAIKSKTSDKWNVKIPKAKTFSAIQIDLHCCVLGKDYVGITTTQGRIKIAIVANPFIKDDYKSFKKTFELKYVRNNWYLTIFLEAKEPEKQPINQILGIDRGCNNIAVCSNNKFYNSKHLKNVKGKYRHLRKKLQSKGTKSAKRLLKHLSGKENRFVRDVNHYISKSIVNLPFDTFALEKLQIQKKKSNGRKFNSILGNWSWYQLEQFLKYKALLAGKNIVYVDARYTSQKCSRCNHTQKSNRNGSNFKCKQCSFEVHADLNAARNIKENYTASLGIPHWSRVQSITHTDQPAMVRNPSQIDS